MLWGNDEDVYSRLYPVCVNGLFSYYGLGADDHYAADKDKVSSFVTTILRTMQQEGNLGVTPSPYPLYGTMNANKLALGFIALFEKGYAAISLYGLSASKKLEIKAIIASKISFEFCSVPKTKDALRDAHPELFPPRRKKSGKGCSKSRNQRPKRPVDEVRGKQKAGN